MKIFVPPIKSQGIKTKLVPWINDVIVQSGIPEDSNWIEPFLGTGVVGFNAPLTGNFIVGDTNPHIIAFYKAVQDGIITKYTMREYLESESKLLQLADENGYAHYRLVKDRFNKEHSPFDFIFLSRAGFNGMMRFNRKGEWNIPFCKKPNRFAPAYITKICNQVDQIGHIISRGNWSFNNTDFLNLIKIAGKDDLIYCDPPYFGRYVDYYNGWTEENEMALFEALSSTPARFILSTWHHNDFRDNEMLKRYWSRFNVITKEHFYHSGGKIENRHSMIEALVFNFELGAKPIRPRERQLSIFDVFSEQQFTAP